MSGKDPQDNNAYNLEAQMQAQQSAAAAANLNANIANERNKLFQSRLLDELAEIKLQNAQILAILNGATVAKTAKK